MELTIGRANKRVITIDPEDYEKIKGFCWYQNGGNGYVRAQIFEKGKFVKTIALHRLILDAPQEMLVDHIDGNPLNNKKSNLRLCTNAENVRNTGVSLRNKSGFKGVWWDASIGRWRAVIRVDGRKISLGTYIPDDKPLAVQVYDLACRYYHREFAKPNSELK